MTTTEARLFNMRFYECRQSYTSPPKYRLELSLEELESVKEEVMAVIKTLQKKKLGGEE